VPRATACLQGMETEPSAEALSGHTGNRIGPRRKVQPYHAAAPGGPLAERERERGSAREKRV